MKSKPKENHETENNWCKMTKFHRAQKPTCIWFLIAILPSFVPTTVGSDAPTAMIAPCYSNSHISVRYAALHENRNGEKDKLFILQFQVAILHQTYQLQTYQDSKE